MVVAREHVADLRAALRLGSAQQYETALAGGTRIAGPAVDALLHDQLDQEAVQWPQTNFLKTELELGHCLRLPAEGPVRVRADAHLHRVPHQQ